MDTYTRPYCDKCRLIWGKQSIGRVLSCNKCGQALVLKSFNPQPQLLKGMIVLTIASVTLLTGLPSNMDWWLHMGHSNNASRI